MCERLHAFAYLSTYLFRVSLSPPPSVCVCAAAADDDVYIIYECVREKNGYHMA